MESSVIAGRSKKYAIDLGGGVTFDIFVFPGNSFKRHVAVGLQGNKEGEGGGGEGRNGEEENGDEMVG